MIDPSPSCPCIDASSILSSLTNRRCALDPPLDDDNATEGIQLTLGGSCVPFTYGSSKCLQHDLVHDRVNCNVDGAGEKVVDAYCLRPWCYVSLDACVTNSDNRVYRSSYFPSNSGVDLFYSYSVCNSTAEDWLSVEAEVLGGGADGEEESVLGGVNIRGAVPSYLVPYMFKRDEAGEIIFDGSDYFDDNSPYEGVYIHYAKQIAEISKGDIQNITLTHKSRASGLVHPTSSYTATVQDIEDGLIDMGVGPFWITGQRLKMTSFTIPIVTDKTVLVIPKPGVSERLLDQMEKPFAPFSWGMWGIVLGVILLTSLLSVWFSDQVMGASQRDDVERRTNFASGTAVRRPVRWRRDVYARLVLDSFIEKGLFCCSAGVEQRDERASLPTKLLLFGFGSFVLVSVSAYVANLAAFFTLVSVDDVTTIEGVIAANYKICAHPAVKGELESRWPDARFVFHEEGREFPGLLDDWDAKKCKVLALGMEDTSMDTNFLEEICKRELVYTASVIAEIPVAFPIRSGLASGFSYWMYQGQRNHDVSIQKSKELFPQEISCNVHFDPSDVETNDYAQITVRSFTLPIIFFAFCSILAMTLQILHQKKVKGGKESIWDRHSQLSLTINASERRKQTLARANKKYEDDSKEEDTIWWRKDSTISMKDDVENNGNASTEQQSSKKVIKFMDEGASNDARDAADVGESCKRVLKFMDGEQANEDNGDIANRMTSSSPLHMDEGSAINRRKRLVKEELTQTYN